MRSSRARHHFVAALFASISAVAFSGCGGSDSFTPSTTIAGSCSSVLAQLQKCNRATTGALRNDGKIKNPVEACVYGCYANADCAELEQAACSGNMLGTLLNCYTDCTTFRCTNGSQIALNLHCDGADNCPDGSDEAGCQTITCTDGTVLPISKKCDYRSDCPDNADEVGCPAFVCASGQKVAPDAHCDGTSDCFDLTDETGCPSFNCANGERILDSLHCNGPNDCTDGSDEANCPPEPTVICTGATFPLGTTFIQLLGTAATPGNCY